MALFKLIWHFSWIVLCFIWSICCTYHLWHAHYPDTLLWMGASFAFLNETRRGMEAK